MKKLSQNRSRNKDKNKNKNKNKKCLTEIFQPSTNHIVLKNKIKKRLSINSVQQPSILLLIHQTGLHCHNSFLWMRKWENLNRLEQFYFHKLFHVQMLKFVKEQGYFNQENWCLIKDFRAFGVADVWLLQLLQLLLLVC